MQYPSGMNAKIERSAFFIHKMNFFALEMIRESEKKERTSVQMKSHCGKSERYLSVKRHAVRILSQEWSSGLGQKK